MWVFTSKLIIWRNSNVNSNLAVSLWKSGCHNQAFLTIFTYNMPYFELKMFSRNTFPRLIYVINLQQNSRIDISKFKHFPRSPAVSLRAALPVSRQLFPQTPLSSVPRFTPLPYLFPPGHSSQTAAGPPSSSAWLRSPPLPTAGPLL